MKKIFFVLTVIASLMAFSVKQDNSKTFKKLYVLVGTWIMKGSKSSMGETWVKVNDNYLQNRGFFLRGTDTVVTERVALRKEKNDINYISTVENQNNKQPISFKLTSSENNIYVFENLQHDFPKRIVYEMISADSIHAWIDAGKSGPAERQDFYYHKAR